MAPFDRLRDEYGNELIRPTPHAPKGTFEKGKGFHKGSTQRTQTPTDTRPPPFSIFPRYHEEPQTRFTFTAERQARRREQQRQHSVPQPDQNKLELEYF